MKYFRIVAPDLAIDLGTANTMVMRLDKGIILSEPSTVALDFKKGEIVSIGQEAKDMIGKTPDNIAVVRPLENGVVSDFDITQALIEYYIRKAMPGIAILQPRITISVPSGATDVENRATQDACLQAGARDVYLVEESLASAYGAGLPVDRSKGSMILNIGAGTTEVAVVSMYGIITSETLKRGGDDWDRMLQTYLREKYDIVVGLNTCETLKKTIGTLRTTEQMNAMEISGRHQTSGMPINVDVFASDVTNAILPAVEDIVDAIRYTLEKTPPELSADILKHGLTLTGGASQIDGLVELIQEQVEVPVKLSENPETDTIRGAALIMKNIDSYRNKRNR